jgi:hypothetical protein
MSSNENWIVGSALLGLSLVLGAAATAMELHKNSAFAQSSTASSLPAFLDRARVPSLHDTWKSGDGEPSAEAQPGNVPRSQEQVGDEPVASSAANGAAQATETTDRPTATVRQRAEELSRRFGGGATAATPAQGDVSEITTSALPDKSVPSSRPVQSEQAATAAPEQPAKPPKRPLGVRVKKAQPPPKVKRAAIPPNPVRSPRTAQDRKPLWPPKSRVGAVPRSGPPVAPPAAKRESPPVTIPNELQSLGWDSQDQLR